MAKMRSRTRRAAVKAATGTQKRTNVLVSKFKCTPQICNTNLLEIFDSESEQSHHRTCNICQFVLPRGINKDSYASISVTSQNFPF